MKFITLLHFMHKWLGFSLFPRNYFRMVRNDELKLLYAMVKEERFHMSNL
jgi:hypothetical protein